MRGPCGAAIPGESSLLLSSNPAPQLAAPPRVKAGSRGRRRNISTFLCSAELWFCTQQQLRHRQQSHLRCGAAGLYTPGRVSSRCGMSSDLLGVARGDVSLCFANCCDLTAPCCRPHEPHKKEGSPEEAAQGAPEHQPAGHSPTRAGLPVSLLSRDTMRGTRVQVRQPCGISWLACFVEQL